MILYHTCNHPIETIRDLLARVTTLHNGDVESLDHGQQVHDCPGCGADLLEDDLSMTPVCDYCENSSDGGECSVCYAPLCDDCADWHQTTGDALCPNCVACPLGDETRGALFMSDGARTRRRERAFLTREISRRATAGALYYVRRRAALATRTGESAAFLVARGSRRATDGALHYVRRRAALATKTGESAAFLTREIPRGATSGRSTRPTALALASLDLAFLTRKSPKGATPAPPHVAGELVPGLMLPVAARMGE